MEGWGRCHCPCSPIFYGGQLLTPGYQAGGFLLLALMLLTLQIGLKAIPLERQTDLFNKDIVCNDPLEWVTM